MARKHQIAKSNMHNCTNSSDHYFRWIDKRTEPELYAEILKEHPRWKHIGIVQCVHCGKVNGTM